MDFRFFKAEPEPKTNIQWPQQEPGAKSTFTLVVLERNADPDAHVNDGFDYFGAYGIGKDIDAWAADQPVTVIKKDNLPAPLAFYPAPFTEA